jgi:hypothetical protein
MNTLKQHWYEALALPAVIATVWHTRTGLGFEEWLGWVFAVTLSLVVWGAWFVFTSKTLRSKRWLWYASLVVALVGSGIEGFLMYKSHGSVVDPAYIVAKADYDRKLGEYKQMRDHWVTAKTDTVVAIKAQMQEIKDTGKLTSRRADMAELTKQLEAANNKTAPSFALNEPVVTYQLNVDWLIATLITLISVPMTYLVIAGFRVKDSTAPVTVDPVTVDPVTVGVTVDPMTVDPVTVDPVTVGVTVGVTVDTDVSPQEVGICAADQAVAAVNNNAVNALQIDSADIISAVARIIALPLGTEFSCPCCGELSVKNRKDRTTCGSGVCRNRVSRVKQSNPNISTFIQPRKQAVHIQQKGFSHAK